MQDNSYAIPFKKGNDEYEINVVEVKDVEYFRLTKNSKRYCGGRLTELSNILFFKGDFLLSSRIVDGEHRFFYK